MYYSGVRRMTNIWVYGRRPSSFLRYRHGGYNALYPLHSESFFDGQGNIVKNQLQNDDQTMSSDNTSSLQSNTSVETALDYEASTDAMKIQNNIISFEQRRRNSLSHLCKQSSCASQHSNVRVIPFTI